MKEELEILIRDIRRCSSGTETVIKAKQYYCYFGISAESEPRYHYCDI